MSFAGDTPAGTGTLYVKDDVAWFDWASTNPAFRGRGGQGMVLCERIKTAIDLGCKLMLTETGKAIEGDPSTLIKISCVWVSVKPIFVKIIYLKE